ncbi:hypothetical protein [Lichenibacterium dinghuense]|uniref:hypothetical protein n=1 Tax=Lichenibacterium dinghuense TaxID=2895977 RepID=UPI001F2067F8|nr:hypothetical protein [Lichenibacterium sp. 6Y81]
MTKPRQFIRQRGGVQAPGFDAATAFRDALAADGAAEIFDDVTGVGPRLVFTLKAGGIAVHVVGVSGQVLGVFADPVRAITHGFALLDRAAQHQGAAHPRPARASRRTTVKETAR